MGVCATSFLLLILGVLYFVECFPSQAIQGERKTKSHLLINVYGIYISTYKFIIKHNLANGTGRTETETLNEFFGIDADSQTHFYRNVFTITNYQSEIQNDLASTAHYHVNAEQIHLGHNHVRSLRKTLLDLSTSPGADIDVLREKIGHCLYTIQQFYSNTNWVEINGDTILKEFGVSPTLPVNISDPSDDTCQDCPTDSTSIESGLCVNNTLSTHNLTSGYKSGQDVSKPLTTAQNSGKCSHGSSDDASRFKTATGGIYKGRASAAHAPHYHLHDTAFEAAKQATIYFLSDEDNGLFNNLGFDIAKEIFQVKSKKEAKEIKDYSIAFAIDVTGSMLDNIKSVITATTTFVDSIRVSEFVPEKYVLVTFSDPVELETNHTTANPDEMMAMLNNLTVSGGGDCPEYSISGLIAAATLSNHNSSVYVYTDASAKDSDREERAIEILQEKSIRAHFRLTSECSGRRKRGTGRYKRQSSVYDRIAQSSGGTAVRLNTTAELEAKVEEDLRNELQIIQSNSSQSLGEDNLPSSTAIIKWTTIGLDYYNLTIEVDETVSSLDIKINGTIDASEFFLRGPSGSVVVLGSQNATLQHDGIQTTVSINFPERGVWTLEKQTSSPWNVNITVNSTFDITVSLLTISSDGSSYPVKGNPIIGHEYLIVTVLENLPTNYTVSYIVCVDEDGHVLSQLSANLLSVDPILQYFAKLNLSTKITGVQVHGTDYAGHPFIRTAPEAVNPVIVELSMQPFIGALSLSTTERLIYTVTNHGAANATVTLIVDDDQGYITGNKSTRFVIPPGDTVQDSCDIRGTTPLSIVTVTMTVYEDATLTELQSLTKKLAVSAVTRPSCNVTWNGDSCRSGAFSASNCSAVQWQGSARIEFSGTTLTSLYMSSPSVTLTHPSLENASTSVDVSLNGDCCSSTLVLSAVDVDGFLAQCRYILYSDNDDQPNIIVDSPAQTELENTLDLTIIGGAVGGSLAAVIIVSVVVFLKLQNAPTTKTSPSTDVDLPDVKKPDKIKNKHFLPKEKSVPPLSTAIAYRST